MCDLAFLSQHKAVFVVEESAAKHATEPHPVFVVQNQGSEVRVGHESGKRLSSLVSAEPLLKNDIQHFIRFFASNRKAMPLRN